MGDFFTSPREKAAKNMYDSAMQGQTPFDAAIGRKANAAKTSLEQQGSRLAATQSGDLMSQLYSSGITPGSAAAVDTVSKARTGVGENVLQGQGQIDIAAMDEQVKSLMDFLKIGYSGLSSSSTFGDILAGLETGANIGLGVATGLGPMGLGLFGGIKKGKSPIPIGKKVTGTGTGFT